MKIETENVRADELRLGDILLLPDLNRSTVRSTRVVSLSLCGDDVEINELLTTSQNNLVTRVAFK